MNKDIDREDWLGKLLTSRVITIKVVGSVLHIKLDKLSEYEQERLYVLFPDDYEEYMNWFGRTLTQQFIKRNL